MKIGLLALMMLQVQSFRDAQLKFDRVSLAYSQKETLIRDLFTASNIKYDGFQLFIRAFKKEQVLEAWIKPKDSKTFSLLHTYNFCTMSGTLGPKRKEGDLQIPEGVYSINHFNPQSNFFLSLGINYPNASDKILSHSQRPGGSIYIHGNCVTIGCIPITDDKIKELYVLAVEARNHGQQNIPVYIFPTRLTDDGLAYLKQTFPKSGQYEFWNNLKIVFDDFERSKVIKKVKVNSKGQYYY